MKESTAQGRDLTWSVKSGSLEYTDGGSHQRNG